MVSRESDTGVKPLVSIVTPCLNRAAYLEQAILSLRAQDYPNIEHVVVDGGSTDQTLDILRRHDAAVTWISEPDSGQAEALNKALAMARGSIIGWLNSDDLYQPGAVARAVDILSADPTVDLIYGTALLIDKDGNPLGVHRTKPFSVARLIWYDPFFFSPQSMFFRTRVVEIAGAFDVSLRYALDYDWLIRVGKECRVHRVSDQLGVMRRHEDATQGVANQSEYRRELVAVSRRYGGRLFAPLYATARLPEPVVRVVRPLKRKLTDAGLLPSWI